MSYYSTGYYARYDDDLCIASPPTVTASAADSDYPVANLISENAGKPAKLTTTTGNWVLDFGAAVVPVMGILAFHYIDAGLEVRIQGNAADSWASPSYNQTITIPAKRKDGPSTQKWTNNAVLTIAGSPSYRYWRLVVVGTNSQVIAVGRFLLLSAIRTIGFLLDSGINQSDDAGEIVQITELGVETFYVLGGPRRGVSGVCMATDTAASGITNADDFRALHETSEGRAHPFVLIPFGTEPWLVRFESGSRTRSHRDGGLQDWPFAVREVSRGVPWP